MLSKRRAAPLAAAGRPCNDVGRQSRMALCHRRLSAGHCGMHGLQLYRAAAAPVRLVEAQHSCKTGESGWQGTANGVTEGPSTG